MKLLYLWKKYSFIILLIFLILGLIDFRISMVAIICMIAPIILSPFKGRFWCGNLCPRGNFYDKVVSRFSNKRKVPKLLKSVYFRAAVVIFMLAMFGKGIYTNWGNLYGIGQVFYRIIFVTTLVGVFLSLFYNERTWCSFCPMGSISAFIAHIKKDRSTLNVSNSCVSCKLCSKKCPMGIVPYEYKGNSLHHPDCIQCGRCVTACPKNCIN